MLENVFLEFVKSKIEKDIYIFFNSPRKKVFFGKGRQARIMLDVANMMGASVECLISTSNEPTKEEHLRNVKSYSLTEFARSEMVNSDVLIAVNERLNKEIEQELKKHGINHIYKANDWNHLNQIFRESYFEFILQKNKMDANADIIGKDNFKILNWKNQTKEYQESFLVEAVDILYPFMFSDTGACVEGPYEYGEVVCKEGEVVIDAGANIGMFSCCAASKGCKVFAFEPTEKTREYLRQNAELYKKGAVEILEYALSDGERTACFAVNDNENGDSSKNRLCQNAIEGSHLEEVFTTSIDKLV